MKWKCGLLILLLGVIFIGFGAECPWQKDKDDDPISPVSGSSGTLPAQVTSPTPANEAIDIPITQQLSWTVASGATAYDAYFGTTDTPSYQYNTTGTTYNPGTLAYNTTYYWRIDSKNTAGTTIGIVWSFATTTETVSTPNQPTGTTVGTNGTSYDYSTGDASSNLGHSIEYQFDWKGDGTDLSAWGSVTQSKTWTTIGAYSVKARARCATHSTVVSSWSSGLSVSISLPLNPTLAGSYHTSGIARDVYVSGSYAYVADDTYGLQIINISNPAAPTLAGSYDTSGEARGIYVSGTNYAYVAHWQSSVSGGLQIINISNPAAPTLVSYCSTPGGALGVYVSGNYAYVADDTSGGLQIINISNPAAPTLAGSYDTPGEACDVYVSGSYAYVADWYSGLQIVNISEPATPTLAGSYATLGIAAYGVYVSGNYAYVAEGSSGLQIINISNPAAPTLAGSYDTPDAALGVYVSGSYAYVADSDSGLQIINISNPVAPFLAGYYDTSGAALGVYVSGSYAYVADCTSGDLLIIGGIK